MKGGVAAAKELADYLRELARAQEDASKAHLRVVKQLNLSGGGAGQCGTFSPMLAAFKGQAERLAAVHSQWMSKLSDLVKDVVKYTDELHRVHKRVKEEEAATLDAVKAIQVRSVLCCYFINPNRKHTLTFLQFEYFHRTPPQLCRRARNYTGSGCLRWSGCGGRRTGASGAPTRPPRTWTSPRPSSARRRRSTRPWWTSTAQSGTTSRGR